MKITIKKQKLTDQEKRKIKLDTLKKKNPTVKIGYNWVVTAEDEKEYKYVVKEFHRFCISIVKDLLQDNFKTNERGKVKYKHFNYNPYDVKKTTKNLNQLFSAISKEVKEDI